MRLTTSHPGDRDGANLRALLTPMEIACLRGVMRHLSSREIAAELGIAKTSVDTYCNRARAKLGVADRFAAARILTDGGAAPVAAETMAADPAPVARPSRPLRARLYMAAGLAIAASAAFVVLLLGLDALEDMRPAHWNHPLSPRTASWARPSGPHDRS